MRNLTIARASKALVFILVLAFGIGAFATTTGQAQVDSPLPIYSIEGRVVDQNGAAKSDVKVLLAESDGTPVANDTTGSDGGYAFAELAAGDYFLQARHACCLPTSVQVTVGGAQVQTTAPDIYLTPTQPVQGGDPVILRGVVKDQASGTAIAVARLEISNSYQPSEVASDDCASGTTICPTSTTSADKSSKPDYCCGDQGYQYFWTETDAAGAFEIEINRGTADVRVYHDGFDTTYGWLEMQDDRTVNIPMRANSDEMVTLFGTLKSTGGKALTYGWVNVGPDYRGESASGGTATAYPGSPRPSSPEGDGTWSFEDTEQSWGYAQTDENGKWEITVSPGRRQVQGGAQDHIEDIEYLETQAGDRKEVPLELEPLPPDSVTITGRVTEAGGSKGVPYADVSVENQKWGSWTSTQTDADGHYTLKTKPGYTILTASAYRWYYAPCGGYETATPVEDSPDSEASPETVSTEPEPSVGDEEPGASGMSIAPCQSGEREKEFLPQVRILNPQADQTLRQDFALRARPQPTSEFKGYVIDESSETAIPDARVSFYNELTRDWGEAVTDEDGSYKIKVHAGYYTVRVWADGYFDGALNVEIDDGASDRLDIPMTAGQKRYGGGCCYGGYPVAAYDSAMGGGAAEGAPMMTSAAGDSAGSESRAAGASAQEGQQAYVGSGGGLGPYNAAGEGGNAPSAAAMAALGAMGLVAVALARTRRRA